MKNQLSQVIRQFDTSPVELISGSVALFFAIIMIAFTRLWEKICLDIALAFTENPEERAVLLTLNRISGIETWYLWSIDPRQPYDRECRKNILFLQGKKESAKESCRAARIPEWMIDFAS